jgi:hypothetical protein
MASPPTHPNTTDSLSPTPELSTTTDPDPLAAGLQTLLNPSIRTTTQKLSNVYLAQQELSGELERLVSRIPPFFSLFPGSGSDGGE